jgi:lysophospholipase L1-like esterase
LPGSGNDTDGTISTYAWTQTAPASPTVTLSNANTATAGFTAPSVSVATVFTFRLTVTDDLGATGFDTVNVTVNPSGGGGGNVLSNGVPATGLSGAQGAQLTYSLVVPAGATSLTFQISGGSGDADLYVKYGSPPSTSTYDCRPYLDGNNESCSVSPTAGTWYVMLRGYSSFANVSLVATHSSASVNQLQAGIPTIGLAGNTGQNQFYSVDVPTGAANLIFQMTGTVGDADLYVRHGAPPTTSSYDCRPYIGGDIETCAMPNATAGTWYVMVRGYNSFSNVSLVATYAIAGGNISISPVPGAAVCLTTPRENPVIGVLPCPSGSSGQCSNFSINQNGSKGAATITDAATGQFTYAPEGTTWGVDTFSYVAYDTPSGIPYLALADVIISPRVMPLGDSITAGTYGGTTPDVSIRVGYRKPLYDSLQSGGYPVDFVGTMTYGYAVSGFDWNNEGHGGWTASEIVFGTSYVPFQNPSCPTCKLIDWLNTTKPDIILLHIGTNGFTTNTTDVAAILNTINLWSLRPTGNPVAVFLAQIINRNPYQSVDVLTYNQNLSVLVQNRLNAGVGPSTYLVDQETALEYPTDLLADPNGLHPDANGYAKMANRWFTNLTSSGLMLKCP